MEMESKGPEWLRILNFGRWAREDWAFLAAPNTALAELRDAADRRLLSAARTAADRVSEAVESGSFPAGLAVLCGLGFLAGKFPQIGSYDPAALAEDAAVAQTGKASQLALPPDALERLRRIGSRRGRPWTVEPSP